MTNFNVYYNVYSNYRSTLTRPDTRIATVRNAIYFYVVSKIAIEEQAVLARHHYTHLRYRLI